MQEGRVKQNLCLISREGWAGHLGWERGWVGKLGRNKAEALYLFTDLYLFGLCLICTVFVWYCICFVFVHFYCICFVRVQACEDAPCWCIKRRKSRKREILKNILRGFVHFWKQQKWSALDLNFFLVFFYTNFRIKKQECRWRITGHWNMNRSLQQY